MENTKQLPVGWVLVELGQALDYEQPAKYIVESTNYGDNYSIPVLTAGKSFIIGYTNEESGVFNKKLPVIIFDDFTTSSKYVHFKFKVKSSAMKILLPSTNEVNLKYFYYLMQTIYIKNDTHKRYWISEYSKIKVPLAPISEQQRIVAKIEELFSELDNGIESLKAAQQQLKVYRQSVLKWAFEGKLTEEWRKENAVDDNSWVAKELGDYIERIEAGKSFRCIERQPVNEEVGVVKVSAVTWGVYDENESKTCPDTSKVKQEYIIKNGDFLFSRANTLQLVGACVIANKVEKKVMLSDKILRIVFLAVNPRYCLYYLRSKKGRDEIEGLSTGNQESMRNIGQDRIKSINISICSIEEQTQVVQEIESRFSVCDKMEEAIQQSRMQAEALRQSILKKAFEGKLVPQDPNDEPAEKLLERIRTEKEAQKPEINTTKRRAKK